MAKFKVGDRVFVPASLNRSWTGEGEIVKTYGCNSVDVRMLTGKYAGATGGFDPRRLEPDTPNFPNAYLCLCEDGTYIAHEGNLHDLPSDVVSVWKPGVELEKTVVWKEV